MGCRYICNICHRLAVLLGYMRIEQLIWRIKKVTGLVILDPWGTSARVDRLDGDYVWLWYDGIDVPFRRSLAGCVRAANGEPLADKSGQFVKRLMRADGMAVTLYFEPFWTAPARQPSRPVAPTLDSLRRQRKKR